MSEVGVEIVKTEEVKESGIKYLNINVSNSEVERNPDIVRLCADAEILEYVKSKTVDWIPVSERLPEDYQNILFSTKTDRVFEGRYFKDETEHQWYSFRDECFAWNNVVTAWMPLPKP